jgi:hypothetical protein
MTITIETASDWQKLTAQGLQTVIDPMVLRCGELFLQGRTGASGPPEAAWSMLAANVLTLGMFFDALILNEQVPVFDYGDTFDMRLNFDQRVLARINQSRPVLHEVTVGYTAYNDVKSVALDELAKVIEGPGRIPRNLGQEILGELAAAEYQWSPSLGQLEGRLAHEEERRLAAFLLGGLIFGGYAQQIGGEQMLQPNRSRIFLAVSLGGDSAAPRLEESLFRELKKRANVRTEDLPWTPTFLPYLLSKARRPMDLLEEVIRLRGSAEVSDYRQWMGEVMTNWRRHGTISLDHSKDVRAIERAVDVMLGTVPSAPKLELKTTVADAISLKPPGGIDFTPTVERLWGWTLASLPGNRYRKLLTRAIVSDHEHVRIENSIKTIWEAGN